MARRLVPVLGRVRTDLLTALDEPASSTTLALYLGVTTSAVNQHLRALRGAGLLDSHRLGRYMLYERSELCSQLLRVSAQRGDRHAEQALATPTSADAVAAMPPQDVEAR